MTHRSQAAEGQLARPGRGRGRAARRRRRTARSSAARAADLRTAAVLRGVPARAAAHRGRRHHVADLRHLPGRLPDQRLARRSRTRAASTSTARSARCAGCCTAASGSPATPCTSTCCTRRTSSATRTRSRWPRDHRDIVERGLRAEEGRQRDPRSWSAAGRSTRSTRASAASTAHHAAPSWRRWPSSCAARSTTRSPRWTGWPGSTSRTWSWTTSCSPSTTRTGTPSRAATIRSSSGLAFGVERVRRPRRRAAGAALDRAARHPRRPPLPHRAAGPLHPQRRAAVTAGSRRRPRPAGLGDTCRNPFRSIVVRAVETVYAVDEALRLIGDYEPPEPPARRRAAARRGRARRQRGAARAALPPLRARRRRADPVGDDRAADLAEPGRDRGRPAPRRLGQPATSTTRR